MAFSGKKVPTSVAAPRMRAPMVLGSRPGTMRAPTPPPMGGPRINPLAPGAGAGTRMYGKTNPAIKPGDPLMPWQDGQS
jgi:hypothetical protein